MTEPYLPLGERPHAEPVLVPDVPDWLVDHLLDWVGSNTDVGAVVVLALTQQIRLPTQGYPEELKPGFLYELGKDPHKHLGVIEALLAGGKVPDGQVEFLEYLLQLGSSAYMVRPDARGLQTRVPRAVAAAAAAAIEVGGHAGDRLAESWAACYGRSPHPTLAYALAIRAVEDACVELIAPTKAKQGRATLNDVAGLLRSTQKDKWRLPIGEAAGAPSTATLVGMMDRLIAGQVDRHGGPAPQPAVTQQQAEQAVGIAVQLVQLFGSGAVTQT